MRKTILSLLILLVTFGVATTAYAGFGISPPFVENDQLTRGSILEQKIMLVRSEADDDIKVTITVNVPGAEAWFTIDKGREFVVARGEQRAPMFVRVSVPADAQFGDYMGNIHVLMTSADGPERGSVGIALGAQIDVALAVVDKKIFKFKVRGLQMEDVEVGHRFWWMYIPAKIKLRMNIENSGNVPSSPTRVELDIFDAAGKELLESLVNTNEIKRVPAFETGNVVAEFPSTLPAGSYRVTYRIYNVDTLVQQNELRMGIFPGGALDEYRGYAFPGVFLVLPRRDQFILVGSSLFLILFVIIGLWMLFRKLKNKKEEDLSIFRRIFSRKKHKDSNNIFRL